MDGITSEITKNTYIF